VSLSEVEEGMTILMSAAHRGSSVDPQVDGRSSVPLLNESNLRYLLHTTERMIEWKKRFEKSLEKVKKHLIGGMKLLDSLQLFVDLFPVTLSPQEIEIRLQNLLCRSTFIPMTYRNIQNDLISSPPPPSSSTAAATGSGPSSRSIGRPTSGQFTATTGSGRSNSNLPGPYPGEMEQLTIMMEFLRIQLVETSQELEKISMIFTDCMLPPVAEVKSALTHQQRADSSSSSSVMKKGIGFFSKLILSPPDPHTLMTLLTNSFTLYLTSFQTIFDTISTNTNTFRYAIELLSALEDLFYDSLQQHPSQLEQSKHVVPNVEGRIRNVTMKGVKKLMSELGTMLSRDQPPGGVVGGCCWSWCQTLAETWNTCGFTDAMGAVRSLFPSLVGTGHVQDLERIEESALISLLDLETMTDRLWQQASLLPLDDIDPSSSIPESGPTPRLADGLLHLIELMRLHISQAKTLSSNSTLQHLLSQDSHREKVKFILQDSWQMLEEDIVLTHLEAFHSQEVLRDLVDTHLQHPHQGPGFLDGVEMALEDSSSCERVERSIQATQENILTGQSGLSGLAQLLIPKLRLLEHDMRASREMMLDQVRRADHRWGLGPTASLISPADDQEDLHLQYFTSLPHRDPLNHPGFHPVQYSGRYHPTQLPPYDKTKGTTGGGRGGGEQGEDVEDKTSGGQVISCQVCQCKTCTSCHHSVPFPSLSSSSEEEDRPVYDPEREREQREKMDQLSKPPNRGGEQPTPLLYREFGKIEGQIRPSFSKADRFSTKEVRALSLSPLTLTLSLFLGCRS
jgi:hypothetical protein